MADITLTKDQRAAVEDRGGSLLVSAAAGSGKTKVLVERLFKYVLDERCDVDDFLIITYTRAAAAELREKIARELTARIALSPTDQHLRRQSMRVYRADIKTVDSFCGALVRENVHLLKDDGDHSLTPDFRVLDEKDAKLLQERVLARVLSRFYEQMSGEGDLQLADTLGAGRDDSALAALVLELYTKLQSHPYPARWLDAQRAFWDALPENLDDTPYSADLRRGAAEKMRTWANILRKSAGRAQSHEILRAKYAPAFFDAASSLDAWADAAERGWDPAARGGAVFGRLGAVKDEDGGTLKVQMKGVWDQAKAQAKSLAAAFSVSSADAMDDLRAVAPAMSSLLRLTGDFSDAYRREKLRRNCVDFSDQEHFAITLLVGEDGTPTELGATVSARYREIMVDEYQDTNEVQNCIFNAVSRAGQNLFTVGDVKQSIYRFRLADPTIFLKKYKRFKDRADAADGEERRILLSQNFRSRAEVLDAANFVFENIFSAEMGELDYGAQERLYLGADYYPASPDRAAEFHLIDLPRGAASDGERLRAEEVEAHFVAARIRKMLDEGYEVYDVKAGAMRRACADDFAILMRSPRARLQTFTRALAACGIPCRAGRSENFFTTLEISVTIALLTILDNPRQDVPLISVLRSPIFGFSPDRLAQIRARTKDGDFYSALAADDADDSRAFLASLDALRAKARELCVSRLLWYTAQEWDLFGVFGAMPDGAARCDRLMTLLSWAEGFEKSGGSTLFDFVTHLHGLLERGEVMEEGGERGSGVSIMSIHKSKGLEFPIVFLCDLAKPFNNMDLRESVLVHPQLGVGPVRIDLARRIKYPTAARDCIERTLRREARSEELRVLYVGMTRAKEKLIMVTTIANAGGKLQKLAAVASCPVPPEIVASQGCFSDWLLLPLLCRAEAGVLRAAAEAETGGLWTGADSAWSVHLHDGLTIGALPAAHEESEEARARVEFDAGALDWEYPHKASVTLPAKVTATQLKGRESDAEIAQGAPVQVRLRALRHPRFLEGEAPLTAAERGTATHTLMQFLEISKNPRSVREQLDSLAARRILTRAQADAVDITSVQRFLESPLFARMASAKMVEREYIFSLLVDARTLEDGAAEDDSVLLQGVVDCFFENADGSLTVVDFKTDRVRQGEEAARAETYRAQLCAYAHALSRILERPVRERVLYFLATGAEVTV